MAASAYTDTVQKVYIAYYGRAADPVGLAYWSAAIDTAGGSLSAIMANFGASAEATTLYGSLTSNTAKVNALYQQSFGRDADYAGLLYYAGQLSAGTMTAASIAQNIFDGASGTDATLLANKLVVAKAYTAAIDTASEVVAYSGTVAATAARTLLATVDATTVTAGFDVATSVAGIVTTANYVAPAAAVVGQTYTLTTSADSITGTSVGDTITAGVSATAADQTLGLVDSINGGAGSDTLTVTAAVLAADIAVPAASITNVETIHIKAIDADGTVGTDAATFAGGTVTGVTAVNVSGNSNATVTGLATGASIGMVGNTTTKNGIVEYAYATATDAQTINISGGTLSTGVASITATASAGVTTATINSTGAANKTDVIKLDSAGANTVTSLTVNATTALTSTLTAGDFATTSALTVTGAGAVDLGTAASFKTIDASAASGGLTIAAATISTSVKGSTGSDVITSAATTATTAGLIDGGAGSDTIIVANVNQIDTAAEAAEIINFETMRFNGTVDMSLQAAGVTAVEISGATNDVSKMTATQAAAVKATADMGASTYALTTATGTSDVLTLTLGTGLTTAESTEIGALTATGFETINLKGNAGPTASAAGKVSIVDSFISTTATAVTMTGTAVTLSNLALTKAAVYDGTALTGEGSTVSVGLTVAGSAIAGSTIKGSEVKDSLTVGAEGSTYNGNGGADLFITTTSIMAADGTTDAVLAGGAGTDTLQMTTFSAVTDLQFTNVSGMEKLVLDTVGGATTAVGAVLGTNAKTAFADGVTVTSGTTANNAAYSFASGLYNKGVTLTLVSSSDAADTTDPISVTTNTGADTITITASSWVGRAGTTAALLVDTGAGVDTISVTTGTAVTDATTANQKVIDAGTGADVITLAGTNHTTGESYYQLKVAAGDSTQTAYDKVTGFDLATNSLVSDALDFDTFSVTGAVAATAVTGSTAAELTVALTATTGLAVFAGTSAASITAAEALAAINQVITNGKTAIWNDGTDTYVFNADASGDSVVQLVGVAGTALLAVETSTALGVSAL